MRRSWVLFTYLGIIAAVCAALASWQPAVAAQPQSPQAAGTYIVDRYDDDASVAAQACTAAADDCSLRGAIIKANASPRSTIRIFAPGTYTLTIAKADFDGADSGDLNITEDLTITTVCIFPPCGPVVVRGAPGWASGIFRLDVGAQVRFSNIVAQNGNATYGGGFFIVNGAALTMTGGGAQNNTAAVHGGGIYVGLGSFVYLDSSDLSGNTARTGGGLATENFGVNTLNDVLIAGNTAYTSGGGIYVSFGNVSINGGSIESNSADYGGGIYTGNNVTLTITSALIMTNTATGVTSGGGDGGGIYHGLMSTATITATTFQGNRAQNSGGGIATYGNLTTIRNSTLRGNSATIYFGGAIRSGGNTLIVSSAIYSNTANWGGGGIEADTGIAIYNSTLSHNRTNGIGGGLFLSTSGYTTTLSAVTIAANTAYTNGGGLHQVLGAINMLNTILADNAGNAPGSAPDCSGTIASQGYNLIGSTSGCTINGNTTGNITSASANLGDLGDHGGPTWTHMPNFGSPALDHAHPSNCTILDQRGVSRPYNATGVLPARCDIGAVEYNLRTLFLPIIRR